MKKHIKQENTIDGFTDPEGCPWMNGSHGLRPVAEYILFLRNGRWPEAAGWTCRNKACINPDHIEEITPELAAIDDMLFGHKE